MEISAEHRNVGFILILRVGKPGGPQRLSVASITAQDSMSPKFGRKTGLGVFFVYMNGKGPTDWTD